MARVTLTAKNGKNYNCAFTAQEIKDIASDYVRRGKLSQEGDAYYLPKKNDAYIYEMVEINHDVYTYTIKFYGRFQERCRVSLERVEYAQNIELTESLLEALDMGEVYLSRTILDRDFRRSMLRLTKEKNVVIWISDKGSIFLNNKKMKPGKMIKLFPYYKDMSDITISDLVDRVKLLGIQAREISIVDNIVETYDSDNLKCMSCMTHGRQDAMVLLEKAGARLAIVKKGDNIVARALIWEFDGQLYHDRVYATSQSLSDRFKQILRNKGYADLRQCKEVKVSEEIPMDMDNLMPFIDTMNEREYSNDGKTFRLTNKGLI